MLDVVGNVRIAQAWGSAQLMAAAHEDVSSVTNTTKWGYAVGGGVTVNLPMIAAGDTINLQAVYSKGAVAYAGADLSMGALDFIQTGNKLAQNRRVGRRRRRPPDPELSTAVNGRTSRSTPHHVLPGPRQIDVRSRSTRSFRHDDRRRTRISQDRLPRAATPTPGRSAPLPAELLNPSRIGMSPIEPGGQPPVFV
jgi:hypothetical protein